MNQPQFRNISTVGIKDVRVRRAIEDANAQLRGIHNFFRDIFRTETGRVRVQGAVAPREVDADPSSKATAGVKNELVAFGGQIFQKTADLPFESKLWTAITPPSGGYVPTTRTVSAAGALTGGGALSANITITLAASKTIHVGSSAPTNGEVVWIDNSGVAGAHKFRTTSDGGTTWTIWGTF